MAQTIHCTVVGAPDMCDRLDSEVGRGYHDLLPWADPYITALIEKLLKSDELAEPDGEYDPADVVDELPPPLPGGPDRDRWEADWSPRNWPRG